MIEGRKIGYARVSTDDQNLSLQVDALKAAGCELIFSDEGVSGLKHPGQRKGFAQLLNEIQPGDTFVVWKLDRVGRSVGALKALVERFEGQKIHFNSLTDAIDTSTAGGRLFFHIMGAIAEFERDLNQERTIAGLEAAKRRGKRLGRPPALTLEQVTHANREIDSGRETIGGMASILGVDRKTLRRALQSINGSNEN